MSVCNTDSPQDAVLGTGPMCTVVTKLSHHPNVADIMMIPAMLGCIVHQSNSGKIILSGHHFSREQVAACFKPAMDFIEIEHLSGESATHAWML